MLQQRTVEKYAKLRNLQEDLLSRYGSTSYIPIIIVTILMFCIASWLIFQPATDPSRYQCDATAFWLGGWGINHLLPAGQCDFMQIAKDLPAFHSLPQEYPPLTLLLFSIPLLVPYFYYQFAFTIVMAFTALVIYLLLQRYGPRNGPLIFALYIFIGASALAQTRYDLLPAMLTLLCVIAAERKHWTASYIALAFGILLKIYPIMLLPVVFMAEQQTIGRFRVPEKVHTLKGAVWEVWYTIREARHWHWKNCLICLGTVIGITGIFASFNFNDAVVSQLSYFVHRPIQIESAGGTVLWLAKDLLGISWDGIAYGYGSINIDSGLANIVAPASTCFFVLGFACVMWMQWHRKLDILQATIALTLLFIATGKVFSPQYLIWLIPLLAYAGACDTFWLFAWGAISLQTTIIYSFFNSRISTSTTSQAIAIPSGFFALAGMRNICFAILTTAYMFNWFQARQRRPVPEKIVTLPVEKQQTLVDLGWSDAAEWRNDAPTGSEPALTR